MALSIVRLPVRRVANAEAGKFMKQEHVDLELLCVIVSYCVLFCSYELFA